MSSHADPAPHTVLQVEGRIAAPFTAIGRVETRAGALVTSATLALIGVSASLVAATQLGELVGASSLVRGMLIGAVIAWVLLGDAVEPLGFRIRDLAGSLAGEVDTYRPLAAAWLSAVRAALAMLATGATVVLAVGSAPAAGVTALLAVGLLASQAESVARRRAWALTGSSPDRPTQRPLGRDEDLVHAVTGGGTEDTVGRD